MSVSTSILVPCQVLWNCGVYTVWRFSSFVSGNFSQIVLGSVFSVPLFLFSFFKDTTYPDFRSHLSCIRLLAVILFNCVFLSIAFIKPFPPCHLHGCLASSFLLMQVPVWPSFLCWFYFFFHFFS